jgi:DNA-directed RNA polymerase subunit K/omega
MTDPEQEHNAVRGHGDRQRGQALLQVLAGFDDLFTAALEEIQAQKLQVQDRESL